MSTSHATIQRFPTDDPTAVDEVIPHWSNTTRDQDDDYAALASWLAFEQGDLSEAPSALAAWLAHRRFNDVR